MSAPWYELLANMAVLALIISIWSNVRFPRFDFPPIVRQLSFGLLLGLGAVIVMLMPFEVERGIFVDLRVTVVAVSGFFGGPVPLAVTAICAAGFRLYMGGAGVVAGLVVIGFVAVIAVMAHSLKKTDIPSFSRIALFSTAVASSSVFGFLALPAELVTPSAQAALFPMTTIVFATTLMMSLAIANELRRREAILKNHMYRVVIDSLPDCLNVKDMEGRFIVANPATAQLMRAATASSLVGRSDFDFYPQDVAQAFRADELKASQQQDASVIEQQVTHFDGSTAWLSTLKAPLVDESGRIIGLITHNRDVTAKKQLEAALADSDRRMTAALAGMADGLVMFDHHLNLVFCNDRYRAMFPLTADLRVPGNSAAAILYASIARGELINIPTENVTEWVNTAVSRLRQPGTVQFPLFDGRWIESRTRPAEDGTCFVVCSDITAAKQSECTLRDLNRRLSELAETDGLTGLLNRRAFDALLAAEVEGVGRGEGALSLLLLDVDRFKTFNDTYGHTEGDDCLRRIAACLTAASRRSIDRVARYGGEEMVVILPKTAEEEAFVLAESLRNRVHSLQIPHSGSEKGVVTISIGVATLANGTIGPDAGRLVMRADEALYLAKADGRDLVRRWEPARPQLVVSKLK